MMKRLQTLLPRGAEAAPASGPDVTGQLEGILRAAVTEGASDIHFEPKERGLAIRFRLDGETRLHADLPLSQRDPLIARGKILGGLDITEKRLPQDGRAVFHEAKRRYHLRLSTLPTAHGENLVIRLLDQTMPRQPFEQLGLAEQQAADLREALTGPPGLIYLTGPTGSGKTTTLHAALHLLDQPGRVIHTLEDPVEYEFASLCQTEIREKIGLTFASALRGLLRQDPNIILVGETRDAETAGLAIEAALTGHRVLSTLHTNDALTAIPRLRKLHIESHLIAATLRLVAAQRLLGQLCPECKERHPESARLAERHGLGTAEFFRPKGCPACHGRGYRGRLAIHEVIPTAPFEALIEAEAPLSEFLTRRDQAGYVTLRQRGLAAAAVGHTSLAEVERVLGIFTGPTGPQPANP